MIEGEVKKVCNILFTYVILLMRCEVEVNGCNVIILYLVRKRVFFVKGWIQTHDFFVIVRKMRLFTVNCNTEMIVITNV